MRRRPPRPCGSILIAEDDHGLRQLVAELLVGAGYAVREAASGEHALELAREEPPAVALLDVRLPGISGYEVCRVLKGTLGAAVPVMFMSGERTEAFDRVAGLYLGADDYLTKPFAPDELVARVHALARRSPGRAPSTLTSRELEVLWLLADGLSQAEIARRLVISPKTVGTHIEHIFLKLGVRSRAQAVAVAFRGELDRTG